MFALFYLWVCFFREVNERSLYAKTQRRQGSIRKEKPVMYRLDVWVDKKVVVDVKSVELVPMVYF